MTTDDPRTTFRRRFGLVLGVALVVAFIESHLVVPATPSIRWHALWIAPGAIAKGDYANAKFALDVSLEGLTQILEPGPGHDGPIIDLPDIPGLPPLPDIGLPGLPGLPKQGAGARRGGTGQVGTGGGLLGRGFGR